MKEDEKAERDIHVLELLPFSSYLPNVVVLVDLIHDLPLFRSSSYLVCLLLHCPSFEHGLFCQLVSISCSHGIGLTSLDFFVVVERYLTYSHIS